MKFLTTKTVATLLVLFQFSRGKDLATDVETAHSDLVLLSLTSAACFFRTNDIKSLVNNDFKNSTDQIVIKFRELNVSIVVIEKFQSDMQQTAVSANNILQLQLNTFQGYEERVHSYEENLLTNLAVIPENLAQLKKDTNTTNSVFEAVDNNLTTYVNFLNTEVLAILSGYEGYVAAEEARQLLQNILTQEIQAHFELLIVKNDFDLKASNAEKSLQIVAEQKGYKI